MSNFNEEDYLKANPDVDAAVRKGNFRSGREHYELIGKSEGRLDSVRQGETQREAKVFHLCDRKGRGLEIGPSHNPIAPKKKGYNVQILDHLSADELRKKYEGHNLNLDNIEDVDFVWNGEPLVDLIKETSCYDWIIASHVIEHVPDLITFLQQCDALLKPDGILSLVVPDRRFCFDYFSSSTSTGHVLDAYFEKRIKPSPGQVFDHFANASTSKGRIAWSCEEGAEADALIHTFEVAQAQMQCAIDASAYIDAHCWRFTPASFQLLIEDLARLKLVSLESVALFDSVGCEFFVSLGKQGVIQDNFERLDALRNRKLADAYRIHP